MFEYKKDKNFYRVLKNKKDILGSNNSFFFVPSEKISILIISELNTNGSLCLKKTPIASLAMFASNLNMHDRCLIIKNLKKKLLFDNTLYRPTDNNELKIIMDKSYNSFINSFAINFAINFKIITGTLGMQKNLKILKFNNYLDSLDNFFLTIIFKLTQISDSIILSYFFIIKQYGIVKFKKLSNLENDFQINKWGLTEEQEIVNQDLKLKLRNISIFFNNL